MAQIWKLARERNMDVKGKKKAQLIAELTKSRDIIQPVVGEKVEKPEPPVKKEQMTFVIATLADGTKIKVPAKDVSPVRVEEADGIVIIKSVDGRELEASIGNTHWVGKTIEVPFEQEEDVKRLLKEGGFYFV